MKLTKKLITSILGISILFSTQNLLAQEYKIKQNYVINKEGFVIKDKETLYEILKTEQVKEDIENLLKKYSTRELELLYFYTLSQEFTIKNTDYIEWSLTLPAKLLCKYLIGEGISNEEILDEFNESRKKFKETLEDIANDPEKHMKYTAYEYFSKSRKKFKENLTIIKDYKNLNCEDAIKYEENSTYIDIYIKSSQQLYHDVLNTKPLEDRWAIEFIEAIKNILPGDVTKITDKILEKILEGMNEKLEEYIPLKTFKNSVKENRKQVNKRLKENKLTLEKKINEFLNYKIKNNIVFISNKDGDFDIYSMNNGKDIIKLTDNKVSDLYPQWSDGKIIYNSKESGNWDIWIMDKDGSNKKQLTVDKSNEYYGRITSDGKYLIFLSNKNGNYDLYKQNLSNKQTEQLTYTKEKEEFLEISPDNKWVAYEIQPKYGGSRIYITTIDGRLTRKFGYGFNPKWTPEGYISYSKGHEVVVKSIYGHKKFTLDEELETKNNLLIYPCCWIDKNRFLYRIDADAKEKGSYMNLYIYDRKTNKKKQLTNSELNILNDEADFLK